MKPSQSFDGQHLARGQRRTTFTYRLLLRGNLDPAMGEQISELLLDINRTRGTALVIVTHSTAMARQLGRTLLLKDGRLRELAEGEDAPGAALDGV